ncbi:hypothetical protein J6590_074128 [Homalodisca vitripennis]|nr:hypothetical protein J6590_074128 [Homalodisca vitripennis]
MSSESGFLCLCRFNPPPGNEAHWNDPISSQEVKDRIRGMRPGSAPGPDSIRKRHLLGIPGIENLLADHKRLSRPSARPLRGFSEPSLMPVSGGLSVYL